MTFKQFVIEAEAQKINYDDITFQLKNIAWMNDLTGVVTPVKERTESTKVYCFLDSKKGTWWLKDIQLYGSSLIYQIIQKPYWYKKEKAAYKRSYERAVFEKKFVNELAPQLIKAKEIADKEGITQNQASTLIKI
jgi:hypothetical protein